MQYPGMSAVRTTIALSVLFSAVVSIDSYAAGLGGSWEGQVTQADPPMDYPMEMNLFGNVGKTHYPSLRCGGTLEFIETDGTSFWYREHLTFGKDACIDGGKIQLRRHARGNNTNWYWRRDGGGVIVRGVVRGSGVAESK